MNIRIVNVREYHGDDMAYIGRGSPLENIWSSKPSKYKYVKIVESPKIAVDNYRIYIHNKINQRDQRIINELNILVSFYLETGSLALGCFCKNETLHNDLFKCIEHDEDYVYCHGEVIRDILIEMINNKVNQDEK